MAAFEASILHELAKQHRVIAFDRPGYGYNERPAGNWSDPARQVDLICNALKTLNIQHPVLIGHSWSGSVVLAAVLDHPGAVAGGVSLAGAINPWKGGVVLRPATFRASADDMRA